MITSGIWKYCTEQQVQDFLLSLNLIPEKSRDRMSREKQLACLYALSNQAEKHYRRTEVPKKGGGRRLLLVPDGLLKGVQRNILHHCLDGRNLSEYAMAYRKGTNLYGNALPHAGGLGRDREWVLKLDIHNFFDNILFPRILGSAFPQTLYPPPAAVLLTHLCSYYDRLAQGAPTSPAISNLVMKPFDESMGSWCGERGVAYTRYCDDLTFSGSCDAGAVYRKARSFLEAMGFELNHGKTKLSRNGRRQTVTGLVVNDRPQVPAEYKRKLRQEIYYSLKYGVEDHLAILSARQSDNCGNTEKAGAYIQSVLGKIAYVLSVNPQDQEFVKYKKIWTERFSDRKEEDRKSREGGIADEGTHSD